MVSPGRNPLQHPDDLAILFGDISSGTLTAYNYNGQNNSSSLTNPGQLIAVFDRCHNDHRLNKTYCYTNSKFFNRRLTY